MKFFQSIRWRIQIWQSLIFCLIVITLGVLFYQHEKLAILSATDIDLQRKLPLLYPRFRGPLEGQTKSPPRRHHGEHRRGGSFQGGQPSQHHRDRKGGMGPGGTINSFHGKNVLDEEFGGEYYYAVWFHGSQQPQFSANAPEGLEKTEGVQMETASEVMVKDGNRYLISATPGIACAMVGVPTSAIDAQLDTLIWKITTGASLIVFLSVAVGWWITGIVVRPFRKMKEVAQKVASGELNARVPEDIRSGETGELAHALNKSFEKLENSFAYQKEFTANASHELRSPIAAMVMETQVTLSRERNAEEYRQALEVCQRNLSALRKNAENLLNLSKLDDRKLISDISPQNLADITRHSIDRLNGLIEQRQAILVQDLQSAPCQVDAASVQLVVFNLLSNALYHTQKGVQIKLLTGQKDGCAFLSVQDNGPGIPTNIQDRIFQRFFRSDQTRQQGDGSSGLGLAIAQTIAEQHGGNLEVVSEEGQGACFILRI